MTIAGANRETSRTKKKILKRVIVINIQKFIARRKW